MPSYEEMRKIFDKVEAERKEREERRYQERLKDLEKKGLKPFDVSRVPRERCDHPNTMENSTATLIWIVSMIVSMLFKGGWVLCIIETIIWLKFITRYSK
jgi:hypothetical protein